MPSIKLCPAKGYISRKMDVFSENDCYIVFTLGSQSHKTTVKVDQALPQWDEWFEFSPEDKNLLNISVMDEDQVLHEEIGSAVLDLTPYFNNPHYDEFFVRIKHEGNEAAGKVVFRVMPANQDYQKVRGAYGASNTDKTKALRSNDQPKFYDPNKHPNCIVDRQNLPPPDNEQTTNRNSYAGRTEPTLGTQASQNLESNQMQNIAQNNQNRRSYTEQQEVIKISIPDPDQAVSNQYMPFHTVKLGNNVGQKKQMQTVGQIQPSSQMQSVNQLQSMSTVQEFRSQQQFNYTQPVANQMTSNSRIYNNVELRQPVPMPAQVASNGYASPLQYEPNFNSRYVVNQTIPANQYVYNRPPVYNQYSNFSPSQMVMQSPIKPGSQVRSNYSVYNSPAKMPVMGAPQYLPGPQFVQPQPVYYVQYPR